MGNRYQQWKERRQEARYKEGYDFAAGALLRGEETPLTLQAYLTEAQAFNTTTPFDTGIEDAMLRLIRCKAIEDNRI